LLAQGKIADAITSLQASPPAIKDYPDYHAMLAALLQQDGQHNEAARLYQALVVLNPDAGLWWLGLAVSEDKQGRYEQARAAYQRASASGALSAQMMRYARQRLTAIAR